MPRGNAGSLLHDLIPVVRRWGDTWCVFGAQAVGAHGVPRTTSDVDVTMRLSPHQPGAFARDMDSAGFSLRVPDVDDFVARTRVLPFRHRATRMDLDIVLSMSGLEEEFLSRAVDLEVDGLQVRVIGVEDLVITKILAGRPKDLEDARLVLKRKGRSVDRRRIRAVLAELEEALDQSDLLSALDEIDAA